MVTKLAVQLMSAFEARLLRLAHAGAGSGLDVIGNAPRAEGNA